MSRFSLAPTWRNAVAALRQLVAAAAAIGCISSVAQTSNQALIRFQCDGRSADAEIFIDGVFKGTCPVDVSSAPGTLQIRAFKKVDNERERVAEFEMRVAAGTAKRQEIVLGEPQLSAEGKRIAAVRAEEARRATEARAEAARRAEEERQAEMRRAEAERVAKAKKVEVDYAAAQAAAQAALRTRAEAGDVAALLDLGDSLAKQAKTPEQVNAALEVFKAAATKGEAKDKYTVALRHMRGRGIPYNFVLATELLQAASDAGYTPATRTLGIAYGRGDGVRYDEEQAKKLLVKAARSGDIEAKGHAAFYENYSASRGFTSQGREVLAGCADSGVTYCALMMFYASNEDKAAEAKWRAAALSLLRKDSELGDYEAVYYLQAVADFPVPPNTPAARSRYAIAAEDVERAAEAGSANAAFLASQIYFTRSVSMGEPHMRPKALHWARRAQTLGYPGMDVFIKAIAP